MIITPIFRVLNGPEQKLKNAELAHRDFTKLQDGVWLNDEVINEYIELIRKREKAMASSPTKSASSEKYPDTLIFNTFMYSTISNDIANSAYSYSKYKRTWERRLKADITKKEQILFPINKHNIHWLLCKADVRSESPKLEIYDSLPSGNNEFVEEVVHVISRLLNDAFPDLAPSGDSTDWEYEIKDCPRQRNCYDCGVCMSTNLEILARGKKPNYTSQDTGYFRKKIAIEIFQGKLMTMM